MGTGNLNLQFSILNLVAKQERSTGRIRKVRKPSGKSVAPPPKQAPAKTIPAAPVPVSFIDDILPQVDGAALKVYCCLCRLIPAPNPQAQVPASIAVNGAQIAKAAGLTVRAVRKAVDQLVELKQIVKDRGRGPYPNRYRLRAVRPETGKEELPTPLVLTAAKPTEPLPAPPKISSAANSSSTPQIPPPPKSAAGTTAQEQKLEPPTPPSPPVTEQPLEHPVQEKIPTPAKSAPPPSERATLGQIAASQDTKKSGPPAAVEAEKKPAPTLDEQIHQAITDLMSDHPPAPKQISELLAVTGGHKEALLQILLRLSKIEGRYDPEYFHWLVLAVATRFR